MKKVYLILMLLIMSSFIFEGCSLVSEEVFFDNSQYQEDSENKEFPLNQKVSEKAIVKVKGIPSKKSTMVKCVIIAPDMYSFMMDNIEEFKELDAKEVYEKAIDYINLKDCPKIKKIVEVPVYYDGKRLIANTASYEYQNAVNGGMNEALTDIYIKAVEEIK